MSEANPYMYMGTREMRVRGKTHKRGLTSHFLLIRYSYNLFYRLLLLSPFMSRSDEPPVCPSVFA
jgi:hypothetical protein